MSVTVEVAGIPLIARFMAAAARAEAYFFALTADEMRALPDKAAHGVAELQAAFRDLRTIPTDVEDRDAGTAVERR